MGRVKIDGKYTKEYAAYHAMLKRCKGNTAYGGMEIDKNWLGPGGYDNFYKALGPAPQGTMLDRIDNARGYVAGNVRWSTPLESVRNRRNSSFVTAFGKTQHVSEWGKEFGIRSALIYYRIRTLRWDPEEAITMKPWQRGRRGKG